jgi:hypothetical protein
MRLVDIKHYFFYQIALFAPFVIVFAKKVKGDLEL